MAEQTKARLEIRDFPGMITAADPDDIPDGAAEEQINLVSLVPGQMQTRAGYRLVSFDE